MGTEVGLCLPRVSNETLRVHNPTSVASGSVVLLTDELR